MMLCLVGTANAGLPRINATCPGDIDLHVYYNSEG